MSRSSFVPTAEQTAVINHDGSAFVSACPGAGKTRVLVERARRLLGGSTQSPGIAFLSFTKAAISELEARLKREGLLPTPVFPHFIGTFDSFIWQYFLAPFGVPNCSDAPRLIPDKGEWTICPFDKAHPLPLRCFDRATGSLLPTLAKREGYDSAAKSPQNIAAYVTCAKRRLDTARAAGHIDFDDVRNIVRERMADAALSARLGSALRARFREIVVDEAQDCNPVDLEIINWLRKAGITTKVICDPQQAIYSFRGGVSSHLIEFKQSFEAVDQKPMSGNFRSSPAICHAIVALRPTSATIKPDQPLGQHRDDLTPVSILSYEGSAVTAKIGAAFHALIQPLGINFAGCPVLAATQSSAYNAVGQVPELSKSHLTLRLAAAIRDFHHAGDLGVQKEALTTAHKVVLELRGTLDGHTYDQYLHEQEVSLKQWRPEILKLVRQLRFCPQTHPTPKAWLLQAQTVLASLLPSGSVPITRRLKNHEDLGNALAPPPATCPPARTIHSVKGLEFPAVCVVMTTLTAGKIISFLQTGAPPDQAEEARKIYVAASRAERLLAMAIPSGSADRLAAHLRDAGATVQVVKI